MCETLNQPAACAHCVGSWARWVAGRAEQGRREADACCAGRPGLERCVCVALAARLAGCGEAAPGVGGQARAAAGEGGGGVARARAAGAGATEPQAGCAEARGEAGAAEPGLGLDVGLGFGDLPRKVSRCELRRQLAVVSACYPAARPSSAMLRQVFSFFTWSQECV